MLESVLTAVTDREKRFVVYHDDETDVDIQFASHNVSVDSRPLPPNSAEPFLAIEEDGEFAGAIGLDELHGLLEPPIVRPGAREDVSAGYRVLFDLLDETVFTAMGRRELLAVSREIEDRAFRVGTGTLQATFQHLSTFRSQTAVYRQLAAETALDIHVHGVADRDPPEIPGITYHTYPADASARSAEPIDRYWTLAFDGGENETQACGLVAREREDGYDGFWTDDADLVDAVVAELEAL